MRALGSSPCVGGWVVVRRAELFKLGEPFFRSTFRYPFFVVGTSSAVYMNPNFNHSSINQSTTAAMVDISAEERAALVGHKLDEEAGCVTAEIRRLENLMAKLKGDEEMIKVKMAELDEQQQPES